MKYLFIVIIYCCGISGYGQFIPNAKDRNTTPKAAPNPKVKVPVGPAALNQDSLIKEKLVALALRNPVINIADDNIKISEANLDMAKMSWLSSVNVGANFNEFVIRGASSANFFPKYNIGVAVPFDILSRMKREKEVARRGIAINQEIKKQQQRNLKAEVLLAYETYKEKKEILFLEKNYIEYDLSNYQAAQKSFADGEISIEDLGKLHQMYLNEKSKLVVKEKEYNASVIVLEQLVGVPIEEALQVN